MSSVTRTVFYREIGSAIFSSSRYATYAAYFAVSSALFCSALLFGEGKYWTLQALWSLAVSLPLPVLISLITMPLFAGERAAGTYEALSMLPISMRKVVVGKFTAAYLCSCTAIFGSLIPWVFLSHTLKDRAPDPHVLTAPIIILMLHAFSWTAIGTLASALTRRPWLAAIGTFVSGHALMLIWIAASHFWFSGNVNSTAFPIAREILDAAAGHITTATIVFHIAFAFWALFTAVQVLEARR